jgi:predicted RNase H-like HicB family nuclease
MKPKSLLQRLAGGAFQNISFRDFRGLVESFGFTPDLDACSAFGSTPAEALVEVGRAKEAWLAAARSAGKPIPSPRYRPLIYQIAR